MHYLSTAVVSGSVVTDAVYDRFRYGMTKVAWSATFGWDTPGAGGKSKLAACFSVWSVVVLELDILVEYLPLLVPAPERCTVNTALPSGHCHGQSFQNKQADCVRPRFW
jgi:hypothetical protein